MERVRFPASQMKTRERLREVNGSVAEPGLNPAGVTAGAVQGQVAPLFK